MKKLAFAALAATGLLVLSACAASKISYEDWKKKADACQDVQYKTAKLVVKESSDDNGSKSSSNETYTYTYGDSGWANNEEGGLIYLAFVGGRAKEMTKPSEDKNHVYSFYSDLSVKAHTVDTIALLGQSATVTADAAYAFNGNGYLTKYTSKTTTEYETSGVLASLVESGTIKTNNSYSISYAK